MMSTPETAPAVPGPDPKEALTRDETDSLLILVHLYMQLGDTETARLVLTQLQQACPGETRVLKYLAAVELEQGNPRQALSCLDLLFQASALSTQDAALLLMQARALWLEGRKEESRLAVEEYLSMTGA